MPIYVAGPVLRPTTQLPGWVAECYGIIRDFVSNNPRYKAQFPVAELLLERMSSADFMAEITRRIRNVDNVIAVFLPDDQSVPVECALAVAAGKRVLLLHETGTMIPRILAGLPGVTTVVFGPTTRQRIQLFLLG
jgi:hypothetical protein